MIHSNISAALKSLRDQTGLSIRDVAEGLGMKSGSSYSHYEMRFKKPWLPMDVAMKLSDLFGRYGVDRDEVLALAGPGARGSAVFTAPASSDDLIPIYNVAASAGHGALMASPEEIVDRLAFPPGYLRKITSARPADLAIIGVKGESMLPTLADNDVVMVDTGKTDLSFEGLFVLRDGGASLLVKRIGRASRADHVMLISDNRLYPPVERSVQDIEVVGKVVWMGVKV